MARSTFHLSLNVRDLPATAAFLELLFGIRPALQVTDYAKFEVSEPAVVLSLAPADATAGAPLNHLGFRLSHRQALDELQQRLSAAGIPFDCEESVACCHSQQTKCWTRDPAGNLWELYVLEEADSCQTQPVAVTPPTASTTPLPTTRSWSHQLGQLWPAQILAEPGMLDEVILEGTFNATLSVAQVGAILQEASRVLQSGGRLLIRGLTADRPLQHRPRLPGPAAEVEQIPTLHDILTAVRAAGFAGLELLTLGDNYRFTHAGAELRETRLQAWWPGQAESAFDCAVIYRGPFAEVQDDSGKYFQRGERVRVDHATWQRLQASSSAEQFVFLSAAELAACSTEPGSQC